jgi:hypothetical protein
MHMDSSDGLSTEYVERSTRPDRANGARAARHPAAGRWRPGRPVQWGSVARVVVGAGLLVLAIAYWRAGWLDLAIGLVALPAVATLLMSLRKATAPPLRLGAAGHLVTLAHIALTVILFGDAAALFYGSMTLVAGLQSNRGCEVTTLANWLRGRDDQVGCPLFTPFDALDRELASRRS